MNTYRVKVMSGDDYFAMLGGSVNFSVISKLVRAENAEEAIKKEEEKGLVVLKDSVKTIEEVEAEAKKEKEFWEEYERKEAEKREKRKAKKEEKERKEAEAKGFTLEKYKDFLKEERKLKRAEKEIEKNLFIIKELLEKNKELEKYIERKKELLENF